MAIGEHSANELEDQLSELRETNYLLAKEIGILKVEKEKYQLIADFTQDWEFWLDTNSDFIWISPSCKDLSGYTPNEFFQNKNLFFELIYSEDIERVRLYFKESGSFMQIGQSIEFRLFTRTKQLRWCEMNGKAVFDKMGSYLGQRGAIRDITRLKSALGQIKEISEKQIWDLKSQQKQRDEIAGKDRELVTSIIRIAQQNELLHFLRKNLQVIHPSLPVTAQKKVGVMIGKIEEHQRRQVFNWEEFKMHFERVNQGFFTRLKSKFPLLTPRDQKLCAYIHLGLSTKDIAGLINITPESAEIGRIRLRKKLGLSRAQNLTSFIQTI